MARKIVFDIIEGLDIIARNYGTGGGRKLCNSIVYKDGFYPDIPGIILGISFILLLISYD